MHGDPVSIQNILRFAKEEGEFVKDYKIYVGRVVKSLEDAQDQIYRGEKAAAKEIKRASVLPPPASPLTEEKKRSRAEKFGEVSPQLDDVVSLWYHSEGSESEEGGAHRKPVAGSRGKRANLMPHKVRGYLPLHSRRGQVAVDFSDWVLVVCF